MSYAPLSPGAVVTATEWNEFASALDAEVVRATGAETTLAAADAALAARATALETFRSNVSNVLPVGTPAVYRYVGADALVLSNLTGGTDIGRIGQCWGAGGGTACVLDLSRVIEPGFKIKQLHIVVTGSNFGTLPTPLSFTLQGYNVFTGEISAVDTWTDNPANVAALNSRRSTGHVLASPVTASSSLQYFLQIYNHVGGTDSFATRAIEYHAAMAVVSG